MTCTDWKRFRELFDTAHPAAPALIDRIMAAAEEASSTMEVEADAPAPDRHLINIWKTHEEQQA